MTYAELVETAKKEICARKHYGNSKLMFDRCETWLNSDQISLYAYWQGYQIENKEDGIDILLVGQDWGHNPDHDPAYLADLKRIRLGIDKEPKRDSTNITNNNLGEMFSYLGIDIYKYDCGKRVFFTNYSLGYRPVDVSESGLMTPDLLKQDKKLFEMLVEVPVYSRYQVKQTPILRCLYKSLCTMSHRTEAFSHIFYFASDNIPFFFPDNRIIVSFIPKERSYRISEAIL